MHVVFSIETALVDEIYDKVIGKKSNGRITGHGLVSPHVSCWRKNAVEEDEKLKEWTMRFESKVMGEIKELLSENQLKLQEQVLQLLDTSKCATSHKFEKPHVIFSFLMISKNSHPSN